MKSDAKGWTITYVVAGRAWPQNTVVETDTHEPTSQCYLEFTIFCLSKLPMPSINNSPSHNPYLRLLFTFVSP